MLVMKEAVQTKLYEAEGMVKAKGVEVNVDGRPVYLSPRESEVVQFTYEGYTAKQVARFMNISYRTVEKHLANVKEKLDCHTKMQLINKLLGALAAH